MKRRASTTLLAGWLFADSLLGLTLVALGSEPDLPAISSAAAATPAAAMPSVGAGAIPSTPAPTASAPLSTPSGPAAPSPTVSATASPAAKPSEPAGVAQRPVIVKLPAGGKSDSQLLAQLGPELRTHRRAAFVLTFGTAAQPGAGVQLAAATNDQLRRVAPQLFAGSAQRSFWQAADSSNASGSVVIELYLFNQPTGASS